MIATALTPKLPPPPPKPRRSRAGALGMPKTRGGCITCKNRRVKCDEEKPHCLRCRRFGRKCEGYLEVTAQRKSTRTGPPIAGPRSLLPASKLQPSHDLEGLSDLEYRYFQTFKFETVPELSTTFSFRLWSRVVLQACHSVGYVQQAVIALGALQKSLIHGQDLNVALARSLTEERTEHYRNALLHYSNAVKAMRLMVHDKERDTRMILIGCLLVLYFEGSQGNLDIANIHAKSGFQLYLESREVPSPTIVEDDIVHAFKMLQIHASASVWICGGIDTSSITNPPTEAEDESPIVIRTVENAYHLWEDLVRSGVNYLHLAAAVFSSTGTPDQGHFDQVTKHQTRIKAWLLAVRRLRPSISDEAKVDLLPLEIGMRALEIELRSVLFTSLCSYDIFFPEYRKIVALADNYLIDSLKLGRHRKSMFNINLGPLPGLIETVKHCRHPQIRRDAIRILFSLSIRQGMLDSVLMARMGMWIMEVEEMGMLDGYIPESARMRLTKVDINASLKNAELEGFRIEKGGERRIERTTIEWAATNATMEIRRSLD